MFGIERGYDHRKSRRLCGLVHVLGAVEDDRPIIAKESLFVASNLGDIVGILLAGCPIVFFRIHENSDCHADNSDDDNCGAKDFHCRSLKLD